MRRLSLLHTAPSLALITLTTQLAACAMDSSEGLYEGDEGGASSAGATASGDPGEGGTGAGESGGDSAGGDGGGGEGGDNDSEGGEVPAGQLTAGEWRDLDHWTFWLDLLSQDAWKSMPGRWQFDTTQRYAVVVESEGVHVADASVTLLAGEQALWSARTDAHGEAELFAGVFAAAPAGPLTLKVAVAGQSTTVEDVQPASQEPLVVEVASGPAPASVLDLMFVIDTTGSMGDELNYLQAELGDVIDQVRASAGEGLKLRVSVNFYRDDTDEYVVRSFPFSEDLDQVIEDLNAQLADGGGDWPEAVDSALVDAIDAHAWSESALARLCFVVLDAPPHEGQQPLARVQDSVRAAAAKGVRLIPLAASGVDKELEFLLRFSAIATGGTYTFLTDHSGIGGSHIEPTIGEYQVEYLNDLLVRLIAAALVD